MRQNTLPEEEHLLRLKLYEQGWTDKLITELMTKLGYTVTRSGIRAWRYKYNLSCNNKDIDTKCWDCANFFNCYLHGYNKDGQAVKRDGQKVKEYVKKHHIDYTSTVIKQCVGLDKEGKSKIGYTKSFIIHKCDNFAEEINGNKNEQSA